MLKIHEHFFESSLSKALTQDILLLIQTFGTKTVDMQRFPCFRILAKHSRRDGPQIRISAAPSKYIKATCRVLSQNKFFIAVLLEDNGIIFIAARNYFKFQEIT